MNMLSFRTLNVSALCIAIVFLLLMLPHVVVAADLKKGTPDFVQKAPYASRDDIAEAQTPLDRGHKLFSYWCLACHGFGPEHPGTAALRFKYQDLIPAELEHRTDLRADYVKHIVRTGISSMPFFRKTELDESELNDIALYLSSEKLMQ